MSSDSSSSTSADTPIEVLARPTIKRARPQLSCVACRQGKLKCDRQHPVCDQCTKRSRQSECQYVPPPTRSKQTENMRGRIRKLESLVVQLVNQKSQQEDGGLHKITQSLEVRADEESDETNVASFGKLRIKSGVETNYVGAGHWSAIMKEIEDVKDSLQQEGECDSDGMSGDDFDFRSTITIGMPKRVTRAMLLQEMPPKEEVDLLLPLFFNSADHAVGCVHPPTFQEEYKQFWRDPSSTPVMWIALLYSCLALGVLLGPRNPELNAHVFAYGRSKRFALGSSDRLENYAAKFQQMASSAMHLADITKCHQYTLETLLVYTEQEFLRRDDNQTNVWLATGAILRIALRMGYHREPSLFKGMSPFQAEMRRRIWHILSMRDALISFAVGLPCGVRSVESDVRLPLNIHDSDISVHSTELPNPRPLTEITSTTYMIAKASVCSVFAEAAELAQKVVPPKQSDTVALDKKLALAHGSIPEGLRIRSLDESITDPPTLVIARFNVEFLYQKTRIVLHRNYLTAEQSNPQLQKSRKICIEAGMQILRYHRIIFHACQPGGRLDQVWWYLSSLTTYDFLLAAMVLCCGLSYAHSAGWDPKSGAAPDEVREMLELLRSTYDIWTILPTRYKETLRGAEIVRAILKKYSSQTRSEMTSRSSVSAAAESSIETRNEEPAPPGLSADNLDFQLWAGYHEHPASDPFNMLDMPDMPTGMDWTMWDNAISGQDNILPQSQFAFQSQSYQSLDPWASMLPTTNDPLVEAVWRGMGGSTTAISVDAVAPLGDPNGGAFGFAERNSQVDAWWFE
ncbi:hypothetical protein GQ43DRAFT_484821 [Delitschia confertaspora ATCC 74209]|uniref:Zn(2)-C6 fungal-type domain-containing protein n=1 Tax=Delitschia confertaspora ATCC 74209 TaxID=1513339 RepID=A0A9P4JC71_9PLEO|nr:hypothetical protein GQ43DRAFT_484821 [Delitschia confertaspora ATCC 74209]